MDYFAIKFIEFLDCMKKMLGRDCLLFRYSTKTPQKQSKAFLTQVYENVHFVI